MEAAPVPVWETSIENDQAFWDFWTASKETPASLRKTWANLGSISRDIAVETAYIWWKMGGKELTEAEVTMISNIWLNR